jgi:hypothetical protein
MLFEEILESSRFVYRKLWYFKGFQPIPGVSRVLVRVSSFQGSKKLKANFRLF